MNIKKTLIESINEFKINKIMTKFYNFNRFKKFKRFLLKSLTNIEKYT